METGLGIFQALFQHLRLVSEANHEKSPSEYPV
jgi:hypothetical protein